MRYEIIVEKKENQTFTAYCPAVPHTQIYGDTIDAVLGLMRQEFLCYVHDPEAEFVVMLDDQKQKMDTSVRQAPPPLP